MVTDNKYYEEELRYLREEGARFASLYPQRARYLNLGAVSGAHPRIERLLEGFAFLCARIRRRLDDTFPELAMGLSEALDPQMLSPVPSACIVEFKPRPGILQAACTIEKGTRLYTPPDPVTGIRCCFSVSSGAAVNPISLDGVECVTAASGKDVLTLRIKIFPGIPAEVLRLSPVRLYIHDGMASALKIRKMLLCHVERAELTIDGDPPVPLLPRRTFKEGGFGEDESLFPECGGESGSVSRPFGMLRDYFTNPSRFLFVDIFGLDEAIRSCKTSHGGKPPQTLSLEISFDRKIQAGAAITKSNIKLHCAPAVNLFKRDAEPILVTGERHEYRVVSDASYPDSYAVQSVISVTGVDRATKERRTYGRGDLTYPSQRFYSLRRARLPDGGFETMLSMNGRQTDGGRLIRETLHVETWQSNGALARKAAAGGGLCSPGPNFPDTITYSNITAPTAPVNPPLDEAYLWAFVSHLACAHTDFCDADKLREFLYAYDWAGLGSGEDAQKKRPEIEAIRVVTQRPIDLAVGGAVIRGTEMTVTIDEGAVSEEAMFLFGTVLARSLSCMASINTFLKLTFKMSPSGKTFEWCYRGGEIINN